MLGNFKYSNPTTLYFGKDALNALRDELKQYGPTIMLSYGGVVLNVMVSMML